MSLLPEIYEKILGYSDIYKQIKDGILDEEIVELSEDFFKTIKIINKTSKMVSLNKFKAFLFGLSDKNIDEDSIKKLKQYINNKEKSEFIIEVLNKVFATNSKKTCLILGLLASKAINEGKVCPEDLLLLPCVSEMTDFDIVNFKCLYNLVIKNKSIKYIIISQNDIICCCRLLNIDVMQLSITLNKLKKCGGVEYRYEVEVLRDDNLQTISISDVRENIYFNELSSRLNTYITKACGG